MSYLKDVAWEFIRMLHISLGNSYYHQPQGVGKVFDVGKLCGYYNDLISKTNWKGRVDNKGIPLVTVNNTVAYHPTLIVQKALGHYDRWLLKGRDKDIKQFIMLCGWLVANQDKQGGWVLSEVVGFEDVPSKYSALTQGEAISALVRAWKETRKKKFIDCAHKAYDVLVMPVSRGGVTFYLREGVFLEEFPVHEKNTILNGWVSALFGIYDYSLVTGKGRVKRLFQRSMKTLKKHIHSYDNGYWSLYDQRGNLSSPFYHELHISQLNALWLVTRDKAFGATMNRWVSYRKNICNRHKALIIKIIQKLGNPSKVFVR